MSQNDDLPYEGLKVLDISQGVAGPHCGMLLARHGADVVKLEPLGGDWGRQVGNTYGDNCAYGMAFNRGKRSLALDLKNPDGNVIALRLAHEADVIIENNRPGVTTRLGLGYDTVTEQNPDVVYLSVTGFGQTGPMANLPATDSVIQAFSGLMSVNKDANGLPQRINLLAIDVVTGLYGFQAVAPALYRRAMKGGGVHIKTSLMEAIGAFQSAKMIEFELEKGETPVLGVPVAMFATQDGFLNINARRDQHFTAMCHIVGLPELADDPKYNTVPARRENEAELMPMLHAAAKNMTAGDLSAALTEADVLHAHVQDYGDYFASEHVREVEAVRWIEQSGVGRIPMPTIPGIRPPREGDPMVHAPHLGEHSREILVELGHSDQEVDALAQNGAIGLFEGNAAG
ncbi:MAG: CoA transferase [Rhodospirillaceae bacterium]|jgi:crotonobetainyl-CoA:carnitine CoA-transferase CaiB-like acyl-CoA transferase|nr:CoA transferase [Rhodospirillaceae bacterium]MBT5191554.1 CoA transferase [Rhodospirillaceae bacterium]MBT5894682.1 CoA transferase [Rhodospirillaceae bacterium]MBT6428048.1 CoA transferase [Rhodospirillaceae bacterium]MBT7760897.1 CoA transferase [Rhodospirillaceae bacterium]